jgi:Bacterial proteasome activator
MMGFMSEPNEQQIVVVGPDGRPVQATIAGDANDQRGMEVAEQVEQPAKVMRIGSMIKQLLEEVRAAPLDDASRNRLREIHESSIRELEQGLAPELRDELERLSLPFSEDATPSDAELRIAQAQLVGWLEGLFHGIQTALFAQQMAARVQLEQMRRGLPAGAMPPGMVPGPQAADPGARGPSTGQYL